MKKIRWINLQYICYARNMGYSMSQVRNIIYLGRAIHKKEHSTS